MTRFLLWAVLAVFPAFGAGVDLNHLLKGVEDRYNRIRTLKVHFQQTLEVPNRGQKTESGELYLRKPGKMRWEYTNPDGKLFVSDGKYVYLYIPITNRVEKTKVKESEDMRAPLGFLLGKIDFKRDFKQFLVRPEGADTWIEAEPKSDRLAYTKVSFLVTPSYEVRELQVTGQDRSVMTFRFANEVLNPKLSAGLFIFQPPAGSEVVDMTNGGAPGE